MDGATETRRDQGLVLPVVMMAILLLTVIAIAAFTVSAQSVVDSTRAQNATAAFQAASSGLDRAISVFTTATVTPVTTGTVGGGDYEVTVTRAATNPFVDRYVFVSVGIAGGSRSTVRQYLDYLLIDPWTVQILAGPQGVGQAAIGSAAQLNASSLLEGSFFIAGDVDLNSRATIRGGPWFVSGESVRFRGGIRWEGSGQTLYSNDPESSGWGDNSSWNSVYPCPAFEIPYIDQEFIDGAYTRALDESVSCSKIRPTSTPGAPALWVLDDGAPRSYTLTLDSKPSEFGSSADDFAFRDGVLYVRGTIFVDGDLVVGPGVTSYRGSGTIVVNGKVTLRGGGPLQPFGAPNPASPANLGAMNLGIVAATRVEIARDPFEGTLFANGTITLEKDAAFYGTVHAMSVDSGVSTTIRIESPPTGQNVPPSIPGSVTDPRPDRRSDSSRPVLGTWARE